MNAILQLRKKRGLGEMDLPQALRARRRVRTQSQEQTGGHEVPEAGRRARARSRGSGCPLQSLQECVSPGVNQGQKPREEDGKHVHVSECPRVREPETEAITLVTAVRRRRGVSRGLERKLEVRKEDSKCGQACREAQLRRKDRDCGGRRRQVAPGGSGCREGS